MFSEHGIWCHWSFSVPVEMLLIEHGTLSCCRLRFSLPAAFHVVPSNQSCMFLSLSPLLFTFLSSAICKASSDNHFAFLLFFFFWMVLFTISCTILWTSVHSSSDILLDLVPWIYSLPLLWIHTGFDLSHTWLAYCFSQFSLVKLEFCYENLMIWATVSLFLLTLYSFSIFGYKNVINLILVLTIWWCPCVKSSLVMLKKGACYNQYILLAEFCSSLCCFILSS